LLGARIQGIDPDYCITVPPGFDDSDDVLLLRPVTPLPAPRKTGDAWHAMICPLVAPPDAELLDALREGAVTWLETEPAKNNFPALPVRGDETVLVALSPTPVLLPPRVAACLGAAPQTLNLRPTARSPLR